MAMKKEAVLQVLEKGNIPYELVEHKAVYTIEEMLEAGLPHPDRIAKNLFVHDGKKRHYYLIVVGEEKRVQLKELGKSLGIGSLSFAHEEDLERILGVTRGAVTPFGVLNDEEKQVKILLDEQFRDGLIGVHPNGNTATVWLATSDLVGVIEEHGNLVEWIRL